MIDTALRSTPAACWSSRTGSGSATRFARHGITVSPDALRARRSARHGSRSTTALTSRRPTDADRGVDALPGGAAHAPAVPPTRRSRRALRSCGRITRSTTCGSTCPARRDARRSNGCSARAAAGDRARTPTASLHRVFDRSGLRPLLPADLRLVRRRRREARPALLRDRARARRRAGPRRRCTSATCITWTSSARGSAGLRAMLLDPHDLYGGYDVDARLKSLDVNGDTSSPESEATRVEDPRSCLRALVVSPIPEEELVRGVVVLGRVRIAELVEERAERRQVRVLDLEAGQHAAEVGAVVAVVEQADVPAAAELLEELASARRAARGTRSGTAARGARRARGRPPCGARAAWPSRCR